MQRADLQDHWSGIQTDFVDEPRKAVEQADSLVASAMKRLAEVFAEERSRLEHQWDRGDTVSTADLPISFSGNKVAPSRLDKCSASRSAATGLRSCGSVGY
jgi:hypothetical protein